MFLVQLKYRCFYWHTKFGLNKLNAIDIDDSPASRRMQSYS